MSAPLNRPLYPSRPERGLQLRLQLLAVLAPDCRCARCGAEHELEDLEVDHPAGRTWCGRALNFLDRIRKEWREYERGVPLRALCRTCNARDAARWRGRARYETPARRAA